MLCNIIYRLFHTLILESLQDSNVHQEHYCLIILFRTPAWKQGVRKHGTVHEVSVTDYEH